MHIIWLDVAISNKGVLSATLATFVALISFVFFARIVSTQCDFPDTHTIFQMPRITITGIAIWYTHLPCSVCFHVSTSLALSPRPTLPRSVRKTYKTSMELFGESSISASVLGLLTWSKVFPVVCFSSPSCFCIFLLSSTQWAFKACIPHFFSLSLLTFLNQTDYKKRTNTRSATRTRTSAKNMTWYDRTSWRGQDKSGKESTETDRNLYRRNLIMQWAANSNLRQHC